MTVAIVRRFDSLSSLAARAAAGPDDVAVFDDERRLTFAELLAVVESYRRELRDLGVRPGDVVAVSMPNIWQYVALETAIPAVDAILLPMPPRLGQHEVDLALDRARPALVVIAPDADDERWRRDEAGYSIISVDSLRSDREPDPSIPEPTATPDRIVEIALTSGTTGMPKLASLSAELKQLTAEAFCSRLDIGPQDLMLPMSPISQGVGEICMYALRGGAGVVMTRQRRFDPDSVLRLIERSKASVLGGVPTMISRVLHSSVLDEVDLGSVRATAAAGAPLAPALAREWEERTGSVICGFYGAMDVGHLTVVRPSDPAQARWTSVGQPHQTAQWQICDPNGNPVPQGSEGEVCMRGPLVQQQYWNSTDTPFAADGWAHFGDIGYIDDGGYLHISGRVKDTIIRGGNNINPQEVESFLRNHPQIRDVAVVGHPDPDLGERAVAFVVPAPGANLTLSDLTAVLEDAGLARYKWPESVVTIDALPLATTGKPDRAAMRASLLTAADNAREG